MPISPFAVPSYARFPVHRHHPSSVIHLPHSAQPGCRFDRNRHRHPSAAACALDAEGGGSSVKLAPSPNLPPVSPPSTLTQFLARSLTHSLLFAWSSSKKNRNASFISSPTASVDARVFVLSFVVFLLFRSRTHRRLIGCARISFLCTFRPHTELGSGGGGRDSVSLSHPSLNRSVSGSGRDARITTAVGSKHAINVGRVTGRQIIK